MDTAKESADKPLDGAASNSKPDYNYKATEPVVKDGVYKASIVMMAICLVLLFFPWITIPILDTVNSIYSTLTGNAASSEYTIPELIFTVVSLVQFADSTFASLGIPVIITVAVVAGILIALWMFPFVYGIFTAVRVFRGKMKPQYMAKGFLFLAIASISTIVLAYVGNIACIAVLYNATSGLSYYIDLNFLGSTIWPWFVAILAIAAYRMLRKDADDSVIGNAVNRAHDKLEDAGVIKTKDASQKEIAKLDKLYAAYGKAAYEAGIAGNGAPDSVEGDAAEKREAITTQLALIANMQQMAKGNANEENAQTANNEAPANKPETASDDAKAAEGAASESSD